MRKWIATLPTSRISVAILPRYDDKNAVGFLASDGPWVVVSNAGGEFHSEAPIFRGFIQVTVYADVDEVVAALTLAEQIRTLIHGKNHINLTPDGYVMACNESATEMPSAEPDAGYATAISMYEVILRSN